MPVVQRDRVAGQDQIPDTQAVSLAEVTADNGLKQVLTTSLAAQHSFTSEADAGASGNSSSGQEGYSVQPCGPGEHADGTLTQLNAWCSWAMGRMMPSSRCRRSSWGPDASASGGP